MKYRQSGFTLIELLIAVAIVSILTAFAFSSYSSQVESSRRSEMQGEMMSLAASLETWRAQNLSYTGATLAALAPNLVGDPHYAVNIALTNADQSYELIAVPSGDMVGTGQLRLDSQGRSCYNPASDTACDLTDQNLRWGRK